MSGTHDSERPILQGLRVLELASILAGPTTGQFLAELGADVIKVENPATGGDPTRHWRLASEDPAAPVSAYFASANWGKRSIALDLTRPAGLDAVRDLARHSDVLIASFKPGDDVKLGLDPATLAEANPALIYARLSAYGMDDPRPGFDAIIQAESGFTYLNGEADGAPTKMPVALMDLLAAHQLKEAILLALLARERNGAGRLVHVSLLDAALASLANQASNYLVGGVIPQRMGSEHPNVVPYGAVYTLRDQRELVLAVGTERQWRQLTRALDVPELASHSEYADNDSRVRNRHALHALLGARLDDLDAEEAAARLGAAGVPFGFVNDMRQVFEQASAQRVLLESGGLRGVRDVAAEGVDRRARVAPPPAYNAHGREILDELAYTPEQIRALIDDRAWPGSPGAR
ncbi:MAG: CaiB/BaiF CoA transferase family protein [Pseudomonadota bacterium]